MGTGWRAWLVGIACLALTGGAALAQAWPSKPVTIVVPFSTGGTTDVVARIVGQALAERLGKPVVVENRTGASGTIGWNSVARAAPDGHTLLTLELSYAIAAGLLPNLPYDPHTSFAPITTAVSVPHVIVVHPSVPAASIAELVALAKAKPGALNYGSGGNGTNTHLGMELFKSVAGVDILHVPYRGAGAAMQDVVAGQVQVLMSAATTAVPFIRGGQIRALMVADDRRMPVMPDVPAATEIGLAEMVMRFWIGFAAPAGTPPDIVARLHREITEAVRATDTAKRLADLGLDPVGSTPEESGRLIASEIARWSAVIKQAGIKADP